MSPESLPPDVASFIGDHELSLDEIELLTAMTDVPDRWWDATLVFAELGIAATTARGVLDHLGGLNLLDIRVTDEIRYRLRPGTRELAQLVLRLVATYRSNRSAVVRMIAREAKGNLLDFAEAFRLRNSDGNR